MEIMIKQQAHYRVTVYTNESTVTITDPLTCHFNVSRGILSDNNKATIQLYNLAPSTREQIFQDAFTIDESKFKYVKLEAGYGRVLTQIFNGRILQAYSHRAGGQTDVITEIQAVALDIFDCQSSYTFKAGTTLRDAFKTLAADMPNVALANMGALNGEFLTDTTFDGNTMENLSKLTGGNVFVDNGQLNCLMTNEVIDVPVPVISDDSCLLETPMRRDVNLEVKMLFEPSLITGQLVEIRSSVSPNFNGQFKLIGFTHDCTISETQGGTRTTTANLWLGPFLPNASIDLTGSPTGGAAPTTGFNKVNGEEISPVNVANTPKWIMPCKGPITSEYGEQRAGYKHNGIDIYVPIGTPIKAIADGTVLVSGTADGYGRWVGIDHGIVNGTRVSSEYGHLSRECVTKGIKVKQGDVIAYSGNTGHSSGPHLHLTIRHGSPGRGGGKAVSPWLYISR